MFSSCPFTGSGFSDASWAYLNCYWHYTINNISFYAHSFEYNTDVASSFQLWGRIVTYTSFHNLSVTFEHPAFCVHHFLCWNCNFHLKGQANIQKAVCDYWAHQDSDGGHCGVEARHWLAACSLTINPQHSNHHTQLPQHCLVFVKTHMSHCTFPPGLWGLLT